MRVPLPDAEFEPVCVADAVAVAELDAVGLAVILGLGVMDAVPELLGVLLGVAVSDDVEVTSAVRVSVALDDSVGVWLAVELAVDDCVAVVDEVNEGEPVPLLLLVAVTVLDAVSV